MKDFILTLPEFVILGLWGLTAMVALYVGWSVKSMVARRRYRKEQLRYRDEHDTVQRQMKKMWDGDLEKLKQENLLLIDDVKTMEHRLEDYRRKISGLGMLSFFGSKRRTDILYSLLLENEALESLLNAQTQKVAETHQQHLVEKLMDVRKRQRLISEIFNDEKIKDYVRDVITSEANDDSPKNRERTSAKPLLKEAPPQSDETETGI